MACKYTSQSLIDDKVRNPCRALGQTAEAKAPDAENVVEADAGENLFATMSVTGVHHRGIIRESAHIEPDVGKPNAKVSPTFTRVHVGCSQKLVSRSEWAVLALRRR